MKKMDASDFKARCLAVLDRVHATGERLVILKRDQPVAELGPVTRDGVEYPQHELRGTVTVRGDIVGPVVPEDAWESLASPPPGSSGRPSPGVGGSSGRNLLRR